ncbi:C39 family peptidase [Gemella haemolysans]|uniref:Peptidase C39-like domain-containing protein n=2 Tax=Gemella haemolysans TaxID=1379 RepID=A0AA87B8A0_9BACL|nr:C39 family peptidase [Gemella haemolysans]EGF86629.1 hypothetical protein HMPREF0428_01611 [Gemella haemolysans M341]QIX88677.1 N-acetylmuramidase [Gemella haemolysans]
MKRRISMILVGSLLLTSFSDVKADLLKEQRDKVESFTSEDSIMNDATGKESVKPVKLPQYYQADARWGSKRYGISNMKISGCVPTSLSMVLSVLKEEVTPVQVADYIYNTSTEMNTMFVGTSSDGAAAAIEHWGCNYRVINSKDDLKAALKNGNIVFGSVGHGIFVKGYSTHAIILSGYQNGKTHAVDPDNPEKTNKWYNIDDIWSQRSMAPEDNSVGGPFMVISK